MSSDEQAKIIAYKIKKARETINEVPVLIQNQFWNSAVNRIYYACFYVVGALAVTKGISAKSHAGVKQMFSLHFILPGIIDVESGKFYSTLFDMRQIGDYKDFFDFEEEDVMGLFEPAEQLITKIETILSAK